MDVSVREKLEHIVGRDGLKSGTAALEPYLDAGGAAAGLYRVLPRSIDEASRLVIAAGEESLPVFSVRSRYLPDGLEDSAGLLLDPARLDEVRKVDARNMMAYIGAGVTFEQLKPALDEARLRLLTPACAESPYVLRSYLDRDILLGESENRHNQLSIFHAILADGRVWASGSHQIGQEGHADFREDQGPQFSPFFGASEDIFGLPVYGIVYLYPVREERSVLALGFDDLEHAVEFAREVARREHCFELVGGDPTWWRSLLSDRTGGFAAELPPWTVLMSIEQKPELVEVQQPLVEAEAGGRGGEKLADSAAAALGALFGRPWYLWERARLNGGLRHVFSYVFSEHVARTIGTTASAGTDAGLSAPAGSCFIPVYRGGAFYCESDLHFSSGEAAAAAEAWRSAYRSLLEAGALVDKPKGELAGMVFSRAKPSYMNMIRRLKRILDPEGRLNPGQFLEGM